jgi:hypothetical protein
MPFVLLRLLSYPSGPRFLSPSLSAQKVDPAPLVLGAALRRETSDYAAPQVVSHRLWMSWHVELGSPNPLRLRSYPQRPLSRLNLIVQLISRCEAEAGVSLPWPDRRAQPLLRGSGQPWEAIPCQPGYPDLSPHAALMRSRPSDLLPMS